MSTPWTRFVKGDIVIVKKTTTSRDRKVQIPENNIYQVQDSFLTTDVLTDGKSKVREIIKIDGVDDSRTFEGQDFRLAQGRNITLGCDLCVIETDAGIYRESGDPLVFNNDSIAYNFATYHRFPQFKVVTVYELSEKQIAFIKDMFFAGYAPIESKYGS